MDGETLLTKTNRLASACTCGCRHHPVTLDAIVVEAGALELVPAYIRERGFRRLVLAADANTYAAAGEKLHHGLLAAGLEIRLVLASPNEVGDVVADERTLIQVMLEVDPETTELIVVAGSGTLHDVARFAAYKMGKPFLSVPTAPSVDGFNSKGAPILIRGEKITIPASSPIAIFADLDVLTKAPPRLAAAGFGDMLGKLTSLFDWEYGRRTADEAYCQAAYKLTKDALDRCLAHADGIGRMEPEAIRALMNGLIESGLAMLIFGLSYPASGAEHHLSHYLEMAYIRLGRRQLLHGAKVGVACAVIAELYRRIAREALVPMPDEVRSLVAELPSPARIRDWLRAAGGPETPAALGIDAELLSRSLREAHRVRPGRHTLLRAYNECGM